MPLLLLLYFLIWRKMQFLGTKKKKKNKPKKQPTNQSTTTKKQKQTHPNKNKWTPNNCLRNFLKWLHFSLEKKCGEKKKSSLLSLNTRAFWLTTLNRKNLSLFSPMLTYLHKVLWYPRVLSLLLVSILLCGWLHAILPHIAAFFFPEETLCHS